MGQEIINAYLMVLPNLKDIIQDDIMVSVTDTEKFLGYFPGEKMKMDLEVGTSIPEGDPLKITVRENKIIQANVPKEVYGFPFKAVTYPIRNTEGEVIGAVGYAKSLESKVKIDEAAEGLFSSLEETSAGIEEISSSSSKLSESLAQIISSAEIMKAKILENDTLLKLIKEVSSKSNLLGLNASIEAARAGEQGRGFSIVAAEMRKLAQLSGDSTQKIAKSLLEMENAITSILNAINSVGIIATEQSASMEEISTILEEITVSSEILVNMSKEMN